MSLHLGLDIGGSKTAAVVLDNAGAEICRRRAATRTASYEAFLDGTCALIDALRREYGDMSIGIALPGSVSPTSGLTRNCNILALNGRPLRQALAQRLGQRIAIANDANCFALSEARDGAGQGHHIVFGVTLGTGCGGGLAIGGRLIAGDHGNAAECGHNPLPGYHPERDGPEAVCYCGQRNCVESFVSGTGLGERYRLATGQRATAQEIVAWAEQGAADAQRQIAR